MTQSSLTRLKAAVLDWAGTTIDYGCIAPVMVFLRVFADQGVQITMEEARLPMGKFKRDHIAEVIAMPAVSERWRAAHGRDPNDQDVDRLYETFIPRQIDILAAYSTLIPGAKTAVDQLREMGLKIGSCTGYTRPMMDRLIPFALEQGYEPDAVVCPDEVPEGRPAPYMCYANAIQLGVYPMWAMVKIGDTVVDIDEGANAGMWTVGLAKTGNEIGLSETEIDALPPEVLKDKLATATTRLYDGGAHYVVDSLADVPPLIEQINKRLAAGERP